MYNHGTHIVTSCQWNTAFDSKSLAHQLQNDISSWSAYTMKRVMDGVFDAICPKGQTLKIKKLAVDLGAITYENLQSELPVRLENALRNALYDLILYPKNGNKTLEIVHEDTAHIHVLRDFLLQGIFPWNYQENYGTAVQIMRSQLNDNRLELIQMIQEIGVSVNVRKRIAWQFPENSIKKIIIGLEPNNHQQIIQFSDEFIKVQEKETIVQTSTNDLKKNIWLWILNYLFTERGTIFNRIAFVRSTVSQMASHFNISYDAMIELIENAIERANQHSQIDKGFIAILKLLSDEVRNTAFTRIKTKKQEENYWTKVATYFYNASTRTNNLQKNEFNELVINLSKLDAKRFQKIILNVPQKPMTWKGILSDLIPAAVENLFVALSPSKSKNILQQIAFVSKLPQTQNINIDRLDVYTFGIEFCVTHQNSSVSKTAFLDFVIEKLAAKKSKRVVLEYFACSPLTQAQKKPNFIPFAQRVQSLYQQEITNTKAYTSKTALQKIMLQYVSELQKNASSQQLQILEKTVQKWLVASPITFWNVAQQFEKTQQFTTHISSLIASYGNVRFLKITVPKVYTLLRKIEQILESLLAKHPKQATVLRTFKNELFAIGFEIVWQHPTENEATIFTKLLVKFSQQHRASISQKELQQAIDFLLKTPKIRTLSWSARALVSLQKEYKKQAKQTDLQQILTCIEASEQPIKVAQKISILIRAKHHTTHDFKQQEVKLIHYFLANGREVQTHLITKFTNAIISISNHSKMQLETILNDLFWQTLVRFESYRGNTQKFTALFEEMVVQTFPELSKNENQTAALKTDSHKNISLQTPHQISASALFEAIQKHLKTTTTQFEIAQKTYHFSELFAIGLETSPSQIRTIIQETNFTNKQYAFLNEAIAFESFIAFFANDSMEKNSEAFQAISTLFLIVKQLGNSKIINSLQLLFWKQTLTLLQQKKSAKNIIKKLVNAAFEVLTEIPTLDQITIVKHIQNTNISIPALLKTVLIERHSIFELIYKQRHQKSVSTIIKMYIASGKIESLSTYLISKQEIPAWFVHSEAYSYSQIVNELLAAQPLVILKTIRTQQLSETQLTYFVQTIDMATLISTLRKLYTAQQNDLKHIQKLYELMPFVRMRGVSSKNIQEIILKKVVLAWQTSNWSLIASTHIWNELLWELCGKKSTDKQSFFTAMDTIKTMLPTTLLITYKSLKTNNLSSKKIQKETISITKQKTSMDSQQSTFPEQGISVPNAGLVILNSYFLMLLERLGAVENKAFVSDEAQLNAVHYLQFIVTGHTQTEESLLPLNKVLVGISPETPIKDHVEMTQDQKELINGLINAAISYWPEIGQTSVDGFRGNWLVREGILRETEERWELIVEKRPYDILMIKSPFSFSIIKLPWMEKPLHVTWPF